MLIPSLAAPYARKPEIGRSESYMGCLFIWLATSDGTVISPGGHERAFAALSTPATELAIRPPTEPPSADVILHSRPRRHRWGASVIAPSALRA